MLDALYHRTRGPTSDALPARLREREAHEKPCLILLGRAWEYDQMSGTGSLRLAKDGQLHGRIRIKDGDASTFIAERARIQNAALHTVEAARRVWGLLEERSSTRQRTLS